MPRLQTDLVREILSCDEIETYDFSTFEGVEAAACATEPDVVIVDIGDEPLPPSYRELLERHPHVGILAVEASGRTGSAYYLWPRKQKLGEIWPEGLASAVRDLARIAASAWAVD
jgi:hypothetical protein